jgi:hypothetical protein
MHWPSPRPKSGGTTAESIEVQAKAIETEEKKKAIREKAQQYLLNEHIIDQSGKQIHAPTALQAGVIDNYSKAVDEAREAGESGGNEIHNRYRKMRADQDREDHERHRQDTIKNQVDLGDLEAAAYAQRLRAAHMDGEAQLFELRHQHEKEIQESRRAEDDAIVAAQQAAAKRSKERGGIPGARST